MPLTPYQYDMSVYRCVIACPACQNVETWVEPVESDYADPMYYWPQRYDAWDCLQNNMGPGCQCPPTPPPPPEPPAPPPPPDPDGDTAQ